MKYINPVNNYERDISVPFIWSLLFGPFYMFWHGAWGMAIIHILLTIVTFGAFGFGYFIFPLFAAAALHRSYLGRGWKLAEGSPKKPFLFTALFGIIFFFIGLYIYSNYVSNEVTKIIEQAETKIDITINKNISEPKGNSREHLDWLDKECEVNMKLIEENNYEKNAKQLGRRNFCTEAGEMRKRINNLSDSRRTQDEKIFFGKQITAHISKYNEYPSIAQRRSIEGDVIIEIQVKGDGTLISKYIKKSIVIKNT